MPITLRKYQKDAIDAIEADFDSGLSRCGISSATGTGKTIIMSFLSHKYVKRGHRVLILVHRDELIQQTVAKLLAVDNSVSIGVVQAGINRAGAQIVVASVQTACRPRRLAQLGRFGLVICDEAHRSVARQWIDVLGGVGALSEGTTVRTAGFSATWSRADGKALDSVWQKISFELSVEWAIQEGFLVRPIGKYIKTTVRLDEFKKTAGDYNQGDVGRKLNDESIRNAIVTGYLEHARDRSGVVFAPTVEAGEFFLEGFISAGISTEGMYGHTPRTEARNIHARHKSGATQLLISCTKLSEGWDAPWVSAGVIARPTTHEGLFIQMVGRLLRPHSGKRDAVILDPLGVLFRHKINGVIDLSGSEPMEPSDTGIEPEEQEELFSNPGADAWVDGYEDVELLGLPYLRTRGGILFSHEGMDSVRFVIGPDRHPYSWWSVGSMPLDGSQGRWLATQLTEGEALAMLPDYKAVPDPVLRRRPATMAQRRKAQAATDGRLPAQKSTAGDLFDKIQTRRASQVLDSVPHWA